MAQNEYVEWISASLVREYLSRKGLKSTLQEMDKELPRTDNSISNRAELAKEIRINKLMKRNKEQDEPLRTMVEIMTKYFLDKHCSNNSSTAPLQISPSLLSTNQKTSALYDQSGLAFSGLPAEDVSGKNAAKATIIHVASERPNSGFFLEDNMPRQTGQQNNLRIQTTLSQRRGMVCQIASNKDHYGRSKKCKQIPSRNLAGSSLTFPENENNISLSNNINDFCKERIPENKPHAETFQSLLETVNTRISKRKEKKKSENNIIRNDELQKCIELKGKDKMRERPLRHRQKSSSKLTEKSVTMGDVNTSTTLDDVEVGDVDDVDSSKEAMVPNTMVNALKQKVNFNSKPITLNYAMEIKNLIFGTSHSAFNEEWCKQGFGFCNTPHLEYGIVQHKGGPCGVLASVQACMIRQMLFGEGKQASPSSLQPMPSDRSQSLARGLADIFWRAGSQRMATVCLSSGRSFFTASSRYKVDNLTETLTLNTFTTYEDLVSFLKENIGAFERENSPGVILSLYSIIFSRTVDKIIVDMDEPTNKLMGAHGYCTQEMVNLYLVGEAVSNVFNDIMELDAGGSDKILLKGISGRSNIGLFSLFEHYKSCEVGRYYKTPKYPIWVVCSESHFSVLFCLKKDLISDWRVEKRFDLYYYDGLARQDEEIRLTVDTTQVNPELTSEDDVVPPLELCIRTKWPDADINWNGSEPIL